MPYTPDASPISVDLSALGTNAEGVSFYAKMHTFRSMPHPQLRVLFTEHPEILALATSQSVEEARTFFASSAYAATAAAMVIEWNLCHPQTGVALAIPSEDPEVINHVPTLVWRLIFQHLNPATPTEPHRAAHLNVVRPQERS